MQLKLYNSLTRQTEIFTPIDQNNIGMYVCGPTVYDHPHIGNARSAVIYDVLFRVLRKIYGQSHVRYVRNITDIDDKIIAKANQLQTTIEQVVEANTRCFHRNMQYLYCLSPTFEPKATEHLTTIIELISTLLAKGYAYQAANHVYFAVDKAPDYGRLSGQTISNIFSNVRIEASPGKKASHDFVLWKPSAAREPSYDSPFGAGRPGWHIECSAMSYKFLGADFDIHGGGADLIFPHHTNEVAQSCSAFDGSNYAKYWVHNGFLTVDGEKMSKSLNNFVTIEDLQNQNIQGELLRLLLIKTQYRKPLDYNQHSLAEASKNLDYWYQALSLFQPEASGALPAEFMQALLDDLNTSLALKILNDYAKIVHNNTLDATKRQQASSKLLAMGQFLGLFTHTPKTWFQDGTDTQQINALVNQRLLAKQAKKWQLADDLREQLLAMDIILEDKADGSTTWRKK